YHSTVQHFPTRRSSDLKGEEQLFSCEMSEVDVHAAKLMNILEGVHDYDALDVDQRWAVRNEVMCLASVAKTLESSKEIPENYRRSEEHTSELQSRFDLV